MSSFAVRNVRAVLGDRVVDAATVVVDRGLIVSVESRGTAPPGAVEGRGAFCLPGVVDTHSDGLEQELRPRPGVEVPVDLAVRSFEGRVRSAGITTMYHGIGFQEGDDLGRSEGRKRRSIELAHLLCEAVERRAAAAEALIDHRILYRLDARSPDGLDALRRQLLGRRDDGTIPLVSFEDHTPGQGQYADRTALERYIAGTQQLSDEAARAHVDELIVERDGLAEQRHRALPWLTTEASHDAIRLMTHDPAGADDIAEARDWNATIAEFPTTVDAAEAARRAGLRVVCGAPNVLRGGSHSGNVSATELIERGLCDGLSSDYYPAALLAAVGVLVERGVCTLPRAVALVTNGPADTVGLRDRGRIEVGQRGDMVLVSFAGALPTVRSVLRATDADFDARVAEHERREAQLATS